jgi:hypothetical protein
MPPALHAKKLSDIVLIWKHLNVMRITVFTSKENKAILVRGRGGP